MRRRLLAEINPIPFVDVALVLLVIFMAAAPVLYTSLEVHLPRVGGAPLAEREVPPLLVTLKREGVALLWGKRRHETDLKELPALLLAYRQRYPGIPILIAADADTPYALLALLLDRLKRADIEKVGLLTQPP